MKTNKLLFAAIFLFAGFTAWAQPQKGSILIGGNAGFASVNSDFADYTIFSLSPMAGFFVSNPFAIGGQVTLQFLGGDAEGSTIGLSPFARYYFNQSGSTRFFGQANITWQTTDFGENFDSESAFGFGIGAGLDHFFNEHVALEAVVGYQNVKAENDDDATGTFGVTLGIAAFIGGGRGGN